MEVKMLSMDEIVLADYNPRKDLQPGDAEYEDLKRSIQEFGYVSPIIINRDNKTVVGGHQRYKVMQELGYEEILCVLVDLNEEQEKLLNLALNKIAGDWDMEKLEQLFKDLDETDYDLTLTGFKDTEIDDLLGDFDPLATDSENTNSEESTSDEKEIMVVCPRCRHTDNKVAFEI